MITRKQQVAAGLCNANFLKKEICFYFQIMEHLLGFNKLQLSMLNTFTFNLKLVFFPLVFLALALTSAAGALSKNCCASSVGVFM